MILQSPHFVVDCPICGRPLEIQSIYVGQKVHCGHCCGELLVYEADNGSLRAINSNGTEPLKRAKQLLRTTYGSELPVMDRYNRLSHSFVSISDKQVRPDESGCTSPQIAQHEEDPQPTTLLVEPRDEIFARLATDIAEFGIRVIRAKSATEATKLYEEYQPTFLVGSVDLPDQSGWLLAAKLRLFDRQIRVWLYHHQPSSYGQEISKVLGLDALLPYQGDLLGLSETIVDCMGKLGRSGSDGSGSNRSEESTTA